MARAPDRVRRRTRHDFIVAGISPNFTPTHPISLVCVCVHTYAERTSTYGTVAQCPLCGELEGTCRQVRESFSVQIGLLEPVCCTRPAVLTRKQCS
jgi:hypothetical protein